MKRLSRSPALMLWLTFVWVALWGSFTWANVLGGVLLAASATVIGQVLRPRSHLHQAVIGVPVVGVSDQLLTLLANAVSLTPGTLALEVDRPRSTLYVHVLNVAGGPGSVEDVRRSIMRLERLAVLALGSKEGLAALEAADRRAAAQVRR